MRQLIWQTKKIISNISISNVDVILADNLASYDMVTPYIRFILKKAIMQLVKRLLLPK